MIRLYNLKSYLQKVKDDPPFQLEALATSTGVRHPVFNLPVSFSVSSGPATVDSNGVVTLDGVEGNVTIVAAQGGSAYVKPAPVVEYTFVVSISNGPLLFFLILHCMVSFPRLHTDSAH